MQYRKDNQISKLYMLDVGQGDGFVIESSSGIVFGIDTGISSKKYLSQFFKQDHCLFCGQRVRRLLDGLMITHDDSDHIGALSGLVDQLHIGQIFISPFLYTNINSSTEKKYLKKEINVIRKVVAESHIRVTGTSSDFDIRIIHPKISSNQESSVAQIRSSNEDSIVALITVNGVKILFTGDAGFKSEKLFEINEQIDIIKVGHHGSKNSTSQNLLSRIKPYIAIISVGLKNSYHHPHPTVIDRLHNIGISDTAIFRTDLCGKVIFTIYKMGAIGHPFCSSVFKVKG